MTINKHDDLIRRLRAVADGHVGTGTTVSLMREAADALEAMQSETARLVDKSNAYIIDNARLSDALEATQEVLHLVCGDAEMFCKAAHHSKADRHEAFEPCPIHIRAVAAIERAHGICTKVTP